MPHILIIDDSPTEVHGVQHVCWKRTVFGSAARAAPRKASRECKRERPDLVIMDVIMPGMNGFQATRTLSRDVTRRTFRFSS